MELRRNNLLLLIWPLLVIYSFTLAPGSMEGSFDLLGRMIEDPGSVEPLAFAVFNLLGIWPMVYAAVLLFERNGLPSWPFVLASLFSGVFSLMIYMGLRRPRREFKGEMNPLLSILDSKTFALLIKGAAIGSIAYGVGLGDWGAYAELFWTNSLVHIMTIDLLLLTILFPLVMKDDMHRRDWSRYLWVYSLVPLLGPLTYLWTRPKQVSKRII